MPPEVVIVLGSGMGDAAGELRATRSFSFRDIPGMQSPTVVAHRGQVHLGMWAGRRVLVFEGRLHYYETGDWLLVEWPIRIAAILGARTALLTNAAGGIHPQLAAGSFMAIRDHMQWTTPFWWRRPGPGSLAGDRPSPYTARLRRQLVSSGEKVGVAVHQGVYASVTGPCYETPAEVRALKKLGADAVGMSTAREIELAHRLGLQCAALSCITNRAAGMTDRPISHEEVVAIAGKQTEVLAALIGDFLASYDSRSFC
ncbi:MAG: purine nucleoside phosphorylase [Gemmatales bacterium]|nr:MAG: purine nucleoside phosphorylase [Gemmatales bacterium]